MAKILITSFDTWNSRQKSNSSDDLIKRVMYQFKYPFLWGSKYAQISSATFRGIDPPQPPLEKGGESIKSPFLRGMPQAGGSNPSDQPDIYFLRKIPVSFRLAPQWVIAKINQIQPDIIINCGMAESRQLLTLESRAHRGHQTLRTKVNLERDLEQLVAHLPMTAISHDAGRFVCNWLYYSVLDHIDRNSSKPICVFVHVPILTNQNSAQIVSDFLTVITRIQTAWMAQKMTYKI